MRAYLVVVAAALALGGSAVAQPVYKYRDAQGQAVYTDNPKAGNGTASPVDPDRMTVAPAPAPSQAGKGERQFLDAAARREAGLDRAIEDIVASSRALREAQERREKGVEPVEGERQGRRFRPEYWQRQAQLDADVAKAQAQLDDALARRNAFR